MTGFGVGEAPLGLGRVQVEVRSLNHRYLDVRVRLPSELLEYTLFVEQTCRARIGRGRHEVNVRLSGGPAVRPELDRERARSVFRELSELRDELAPGQEVPLALLGSVPDLFVADSGAGVATLRVAIGRACLEAVDRSREMRAAEGTALQGELRSRLERSRELTAQMEAQAGALVDAQRQRLRERIGRLISGTQAELDPGRLELEVALLAEKSDIAEELLRLCSHFDQFASLLERADPVGRALDFLLQEMMREANTIGSKSQDTRVSHLVVELKSELERLREQVQNVE